MAQVGNLFENQTVNGTSEVVEISNDHKNLKVEGVFDGASINMSS